ncbi:DNA/RNA helicase domain-containing protein [Chromobacterium violaceum]|uniref:DNA/RNA helicase domain-containing protein n=1 Tax=Chromobacterium violaceum TaxID=536 RepID=UPI00385D5367
MRCINLLSLIQAYQNLNDSDFSKLSSYYGVSLRGEEIKDLSLLVGILCEVDFNGYILNKFYVGFKIPQIGKEFDLLRFGKDRIINIELKKTASLDKIKKQLVRNAYYLRFLGKEVHCFTFVSEAREFFYLNNADEISATNIAHLIYLLNDMQDESIQDIKGLFNPSDYLVSPFNTVSKFVNGEYFLTHQQEEILKDIIDSISTTPSFKFFSLTGSAGTGKTLLTYSIAAGLIKSGRLPLIIHCGNLNGGQLCLRGDYQWKIVSIKDHNLYDLSSYDLVIIDEAQRIYPNQLNEIIEKIKLSNGKCIFSYDKIQTLSQWEERYDIDNAIKKIESIVSFNLTEKIRTNKEMASFIKSIFNSKALALPISSNNIDLNYFSKCEDARKYLDTIDTQEWEILRFTPSQYNREHHETYSNTSNETSHGVIGQEFENVVVTVDQFFDYNEHGDLIYRGRAYYDPVKMLFQNITRTRRRLNLVIINNSVFLNRCIEVLKG